MVIAKNRIVTLGFTLSDEHGEILERSDPSISYLHGGYEEIFPQVEAALQDRQAGYEISITLTPEHAFGHYDPGLHRLEPRRAFPADLQVGMRFAGQPEGESRMSRVQYVVKAADETTVELDGNHPLVGRTVVFNCRVLDVREATSDEIAERERFVHRQPPALR